MLTSPGPDNHSVLVVDDDMTTRLITRAALEKVGFRVQEAENGRLAVEAFRHSPPDIVLMDIVMPELDGFAACRLIRESPRGQQLPIVMITGLEDMESIHRTFEAGATDYITKPINYALLGYRLRYIHIFFQKQILEKQLLQSQKMEALGRLAGGVAHDFNNLLMVILSSAEVMLESEAANHPAELEEIRTAASQAASLTQQLLAFSRKQILHFQDVDLNSIVDGTSKMLRRIIGEDVELITVLDGAEHLVRADKSQLEQVILNLVVNARDALPQGGKITVKVSRELVDRSADLPAKLPPGPYITLSVSDNGIGMDQDILERIFEPFFTTKGLDVGTGLGLSTVQGIVEQSGGQVWVTSEPGRGSTFTVCLPQAVRSQEEVARGEAADGPLEGWETILLVEDEDAVRRLVLKILRRYGYQALEARSGEEALIIGAQHRQPIHLLFTDLVMSGMNGKDLAARWLDLHPESRVLFTSGYIGDVVFGDNGSGVEPDFIHKPYKPRALAAKLREILNRPGERRVSHIAETCTLTTQ